jgi:hypothetical protein
MERRAGQRLREELQRQREVARVRLQQEPGRYLVCLGDGAADLKRLLYRHMSRASASSRRLRQRLGKLSGSPDWNPVRRLELDNLTQSLSDSQRKVRLLGKERMRLLRSRGGWLVLEP